MCYIYVYLQERLRQDEERKEGRPKSTDLMASTRENIQSLILDPAPQALPPHSSSQLAPWQQETPSDRPFPSMMAPPKQKKVSMRLCPERSPHEKGGGELDSCPSLELSIAVICGATGVRIVVTLQHSKLQVDCRPTLRAVSPPREGRGQARPGSALVWIEFCISRPP